MRRVSFLASLLLIALFLTTIQPVLAQELEVIVETHFDAPTIVKGFTLESHDGVMRLGIRPNTLNVSTRVDIKTLEPELMAETLPEDKVLLSKIYLFDIINKESYDGTDFFFLQIGYEDESLAQKKIYFFNGVTGTWEILPSEDNPDISRVQALIHLPYARLAVFADDSVMEYGQASWYKYRDCDCAASPDYPKGTQLLVTSINFPDRSVVVEVNDFGPERDIFPERVIDLDVIAFEQLAPKGAGVIDVRVQLLQPAAGI